MKAWLKQLSAGLNFTPTERAVALTLAGALLLGLGIRLFRDGSPATPQFDYSAADAEFAARSAAPLPVSPGVDPASAPSDETADTTTPGARQPAAAGGGAGRKAETPRRVDLNKATKRDLMYLPGVGEVIAERILVYREEHGAFAGVNDLLKVKGIGKKKLERIAPYCFVEN
jgi:competence ComEA-like helix-hairpin-helix protein